MEYCSFEVGNRTVLGAIGFHMGIDPAPFLTNLYQNMNVILWVS